MRLRGLLLVVLAVVALVALWQGMRPRAVTPGPASAVARSIDWVVRDGRRSAGPERVVASVDDRLLLRVRSNRPDQLHVHGYEIARELPAGEQVEIALPLTQSGRFDIELHHAHQLLAVLEVQPR